MSQSVWFKNYKRTKVKNAPPSVKTAPKELQIPASKFSFGFKIDIPWFNQLRTDDAHMRHA